MSGTSMAGPHVVGLVALLLEANRRTTGASSATRPGGARGACLGHNRVILLGDAAHGMTSNQGQDAALAIEDALALAQPLAVGVEGALDRYRSVRHA